MMHIGFLIAGMVLASFCASGAVDRKPLIVLIKLDDVHGMHPRYLQVAEFAKAENIKINFGVFGSALEKDNPQFFTWMKQLQETGLFEFWNHGYGGFGHPRENEGTGYEFQRQKIARTQELSRQRFGAPFRAYGPHASGMDDDTWKALAESPEIKLVFGRIPPGKLPGVFAADSRMPFENAALKPDIQRFKDRFESVTADREYVYIQGHPNAWKEEADFDAFKEMVRFLKTKGVRFMTISEFLETRSR